MSKEIKEFKVVDKKFLEVTYVNDCKLTRIDLEALFDAKVVEEKNKQNCSCKGLKALKDFYIFFKQCEIENKYDKQLTNHFLGLHNIIEKELKEHEQYKAIEKEQGMELSLFFKIMKAQTLWWKDKNKKHTHNIASEFITIKPYLSIAGFMMFEFSWNDRNIYAYENCDVIIKEDESPIGKPHIYLYLKASEYGKTWALTKEELL